ncbi:hypothetical protein [Phenylobacterium deserti]|uniref:Terminase small subunit n=1 Tax=Phenylobacterium deserti TaxID=1914756 RepID=A0A328ADK7_9CAUL|nr:hypothetical protein [Phenylobacterium deserti]RAK52587.1 hypothetical protein DJ018_10275 [Phenylobacterium deserti]
MARSPRQKQPTPRSKRPNKRGEVVQVRYSREVAERICDRMSKGDVWFKICNTDGMPAYATLYQWLRKYPDFAEAYAQAKEVAGELRADQALMVAEACTPATVTADRLKVSTLQWMASKHAPARFGSRGAKADPEEVVITIKPRQFERAVRADGTIYVRDVTPGEGDRD